MGLISRVSSRTYSIEKTMLRSRSAVNSAVFSRRLWLLNAYKQTPQSVARQARRIIYGEHKPIYHPQQDVGDKLVIINSKEIKVHGNMWEEKYFYENTARRNGSVRMVLREVHLLDPTKIVKSMVHAELKRGKQNH